MSRRMWKVVEIKARKTWVAKTKRRREKEEKREKTKEEKNNSSKKNCRRIENLE